MFFPFSPGLAAAYKRFGLSFGEDSWSRRRHKKL